MKPSAKITANTSMPNCPCFSTHLALAVILVTTITACGKPYQKTFQNALKESYLLMDKGHNAKAILILEAAITKDPQNREARVLLASAYLGEAGVDVYKIHDSFKDILFKKSLGESFWQGPNSDPSNDSSVTSQSRGPSQNLITNTPIEVLLSELGSFLLKLNQVVGFLNRFPNVDSGKWSLLETALHHLDPVKSTTDVSLYRVFIRIIYLRAYLSQKLISDPDFGSKKWACNADIWKFQENLVWIGKNLTRGLEDFREVYPEKSSTLIGFKKLVETVLDALEKIKTTAPAGSLTGTYNLQQRLREELKCGQTDSTSGS